jgi:xanthine/uracil permease
VPGLVTVTLALPAAATALAGIVALTSVALSKVVAMAAPLNFTTAFEPKFVPCTVSVKSELPAAVLGGVSCAMVGMVPGAGGVVAWLE